MERSEDFKIVEACVSDVTQASRDNQELIEHKDFGGASASQTVNVYFAAIPYGVEPKAVIPAERDAEISRVSNERVKVEKYCVWKLLEYAAEHSFGYQMENLRFERTQNGKWVSDSFEFSLSHCDGAVAVAVSCDPVGIDVERAEHKFREKFADTVLHNNEKALYSALEEAERDKYLMSVWTQKESLFKKTGDASFSPRSIDTTKAKTRHGSIEIGGRRYAFSVATDAHDEIKLFYVTFER